MMTAMETRRFPNSTAWWIRGLPRGEPVRQLPESTAARWGTRRPDAVTRTIAPVTAIPPLGEDDREGYGALHPRTGER